MSDMMLRFETRAQQRRLVSKIELQFRTFDPLPLKNLRDGRVEYLSNFFQV